MQTRINGFGRTIDPESIWCPMGTASRPNGMEVGSHRADARSVGLPTPVAPSGPPQGANAALKLTTSL